MKTLKNIGMCLGTCAALAALPAAAAPEAGDNEVVLAGNGTSDQDFDTNAFGLSGHYGWYLSDSFELGIRQSLSGVSVDDGDDTWAGSTRVFADYHFGRGTVLPFVGANIGGIYGEGVNDTGAAGVEAGLKWFVKEETFIMFMAEYQFLFEDADDIDDTFDDGAFSYTVGVGFTF
jgi:hypothetical protein